VATAAVDAHARFFEPVMAVLRLIATVYHPPSDACTAASTDTDSMVGYYSRHRLRWLPLRA